MDSVDQLQMLHEAVKLWVIMDKIEKNVDIPEVCSVIIYVIVRPLSTVGYTSVAASVIHSRQWSN